MHIACVYTDNGLPKHERAFGKLNLWNFESQHVSHSNQDCKSILM